LADITKAVRFLILGDASGASKAFKGLSGDMSKLGKQTPFKGLSADLRSAVKSGQGLSGVKGVLKGAATEAGGLGGMAKKAAIGVGAIGAAAVAAGAAVAVKFGADSIDTFKRVGGEVKTLARLTGMSAEESSRLNFGFKQTGVDGAAGAKAIGIFSKGIVKMSDADEKARATAAAKAQTLKAQIATLEASGTHTKGYADKLATLKDKLADATLASKTNTSALGAMGIQYTDAHGKLLPMSTLLPKVADQFKDMPDGPEKTALAMKLFGKSGTQLLPFLNKGAEGMREFAAESDKTGNTLSGKQLDALNASKKAQKEWDASMQGLQVTLGSTLLPMVTQWATGLNNALIPAIQGTTHWIQQNQSTFDALGNGMRVVWNNIIIPLIKGAVIGFAEMNKPLANGVILLGQLTGNKDMENFGRGVLKMANDAETFANNLKGIPDQVSPKITANDKATAVVKKIDTEIKSVKDKIVTAKAKGDHKEVDELKDRLALLKDQRVKAEAIAKGGAEVDDLKTKINALHGRNVDVTASVKLDPHANEIVFKATNHGTVKVGVLASGGILKSFANGGIEDHSPRIYRPMEGMRLFNEPETRGESYIPLANDWRRPRAVQIWRQTGRMLGQFAGGGMLGGPNSSGGGDTYISVAVTVQGDSDPHGAARRIEAKLVDLMRSRGGRKLAFT